MRRELEPSPLVRIQSPDPYKLRAYLEREHRRQAIVRQHPDVIMVRPGMWAAEVVQLRRPRPRWVAPAAVLAGLAGVVAAGWWLVTAVTAVLAGMSLAGLVGAAALAVLLSRLPASRGHGCETTVTVRHRH